MSYTTIATWLQGATGTLSKAGIDSARLDALLILCDLLDQDKAWLLAHDDMPLAAPRLLELNAKLDRRSQREPMAYIRGLQEFYGRDFMVTPDVLVPRPETESIIELFATMPMAGQNVTVADVGTGSGAIAITLKLEHPELKVIAVDTSEPALTVANRNAEKLNAEIDFRQGNLLGPISERVDVIVANLPYVDKSWQRSPETDYEPPLALFAADGGLALIRQLLRDAPARLNISGLVLLEADPEQHADIINSAAAHGLRHMGTHGYALALTG